jgi:hypothetical protein
MSATGTATLVVGKSPAVETTTDEARHLEAWLLRVPVADVTWRTWEEVRAS